MTILPYSPFNVGIVGISRSDYCISRAMLCFRSDRRYLFLPIWITFNILIMSLAILAQFVAPIGAPTIRAYYARYRTHFQYREKQQCCALFFIVGIRHYLDQLRHDGGLLCYISWHLNSDNGYAQGNEMKNRCETWLEKHVLVRQRITCL